MMQWAQYEISSYWPRAARMPKRYEPEHDKQHAPSEESAQSDQSICCPHGETMALDSTAKTDQTGPVPRLI